MTTFKAQSGHFWGPSIKLELVHYKFTFKKDIFVSVGLKLKIEIFIFRAHVLEVVLCSIYDFTNSSTLVLKYTSLVTIIIYGT